jgi:hypothetical protein
LAPSSPCGGARVDARRPWRLAVFVHVVRTPRMPARRPFESDENSLIGESKKPTFFPRDLGAGQGGSGML